MLKTISKPMICIGLLSVFGCPGGQTAITPNGSGNNDGNVTEEDQCGSAIEAAVPEEAAVLQNGNAPNLSCLDTPEQLDASVTVTMQGCLDIFGIGSMASPNLKVAAFSRDQDPSEDTPNYGVSDVALRTTEGELGELADACPYKGYYRIENVPTHERLILKIYDTSDDFSRVAVNTYVYDVFLRNSDAVEGAINYEPVVIYNSSYDSIPTLAGRPVEGGAVKYDNEGRAVVAGEVHDCDGQVIQNTNVTPPFNDSQARMVFTDGDPDDPKPDVLRSSTNSDGLYVYLNVNTQPACMTHTFTSCILDGSECKKIGDTTVNAYPDSVTLVNIRTAWPVVDGTAGSNGTGE